MTDKEMQCEKPTPGPWQILKAQNGMLLVHTGQHDSFRTIAYIAQDLAETVANAHLIAAAPDLLDALERCQAYASREDFEMNAEQRLLQVHRITKTAIAAEKGK